MQKTGLNFQLPQNLEKIYIACSGGIDSTVLLHATVQYVSQHQLIVWHINHGLQNNAQDTEQFVREQAAFYGLECRVDHFNMDAAGSNLEARARNMRYALFAQALSCADALLTAHHQNDQAETLLLNLLRGAGSAGLSAIAYQRRLGKGLLLRPLIHNSRNDIERYAAQNQLQWIEDPSNADDHFDRNYLRHEILPRLHQRWPAVISQLQRVSELQHESHALQQALAELDYAEAKVTRPFSGSDCLSIDVLSSYTPARQKNIIRYWISKQGQPVPGFRKMQELLRQIPARSDAMVQLAADSYSVRCYRRDLYLLSALPRSPSQEYYELPDSGKLHIDALDLTVTRKQLFEQLQREDTGQKLQLRFRTAHKGGGVAIAHSHRLKRLFQHHCIPPWMRDCIPQIMLDGELAGLYADFMTSAK